jgi:hypothetical protein
MGSSRAGAVSTSVAPRLRSLRANFLYERAARHSSRWCCANEDPNCSQACLMRSTRLRPNTLVDMIAIRGHASTPTFESQREATPGASGSRQAFHSTSGEHCESAPKSC